MHISQKELAQRLNIPQPRISELETKLKSGNMTEQLKLIADLGEQLGLSLMMVPDELVPDVHSKIQDYDIEQEFGSKSIFDQIFDEVAEYEGSPVPRYR
jgi:transcriptional regulator with XRE-family HTH domain